MDSLTIQGNIYDLQFIEILMKDGTDDERALDIFKQFQRDIYTTYKQIRHIHKPKACEKLSLEKVKANLRDHWLEIYLNMTRQEAETVIEYAEAFFGLAIK
ncbi:uncharacterized protein KNN_00624 [Bacillus thuringiensis serovar tolworthi]|uniref:Uncharacterized protein n=1 Tax=Bacillus thuringiensis subsp. tolworthi TaxID=1442 RepID=A0A9W4A4N8_BACTO|nr:MULTISPECIES: hypothetical protein [Bacillus cereus group]MEB8712949.1 hypothetical protein [Bacillus cereus]MEB9594844.1 hypothetical protein [Bacillus cereus]BAR81499.1 uncharacterized protein KNN_00624 [Bacillus thuringiensis serovar tolworthi]